MACCSGLRSKSIAPILACTDRRPIFRGDSDRDEPRGSRWTQRQPTLPHAPLLAWETRRALARPVPWLHELPAAVRRARPEVPRARLERAHPTLSKARIHRPPEHGDRLTVAGLSLGAILTGCLAQTRDGIDRAVLIAPMLGLRRIPGPVLTTMGIVAKRIPNFYMWWHDEQKEKLGPAYGYPRFPTHAYAALFDAGRILVRSARREPPKARSI